MGVSKRIAAQCGHCSPPDQVSWKGILLKEFQQCNACTPDGQTGREMHACCDDVKIVMLYNQKNENINSMFDVDVSTFKMRKESYSRTYMNVFHHVYRMIVSYWNDVFRRGQLHGFPRPTRDWQSQAWQHVHWSTQPVG